MTVNPFRLDGRVAIVTGGGGGLGSGICPALAAAGATVVVAGRTKEKLDARCRRRKRGWRAGASPSRSTSPIASSVAAMTERVLSELGGIDILVNNAAVYHRKPWTEITEADWDQVLDTNLKGYYLCARAAYPALKASGSRPGHQRRLDHLLRRYPEPARLCRLQGRHRRLHAGLGTGGRAGRHHRQHPLARGIPDRCREDPSRPGKLQPGDPRRPKHQATGHSRGRRQPGDLPGRRRLVIHHRPVDPDRRRLDDALRRRVAW